MTASIVDTNVLLVANGIHDDANAEPGTPCRLSAIDSLVKVMEERTLALDGGREILNEYSRKCSYAGQPGVGDRFFLWAHQNAASLTAVTLTAHPDRGFAEFPDDPALVGFDPDDRVFVATAMAGPQPNRIVNAVDSDYRNHQLALQRAGITVDELCPGLLARP